MLKPLLTSYILHLLEYIETHATQCFVTIFEWFREIFHIFWIINIFTWIESSTLNLIETIIQMLRIALINIY
jgi:hypothetical protein